MRRAREWPALVLAVGVMVAVGAARGAPVIVDLDNDVAVQAPVGSWVVSSYHSERIGPDYLHSNKVAGLTATYTPDLPYAGDWRVQAHWNGGSDRGDDVPYTITYAGGATVTVHGDQRNSPGWNTLGIWAFDAGTVGSVEVSSTVPNNQYVIADAVRFIDVASMGPPPSGKLIPSASVTGTASSFYPTSNRGPSQAVNGTGMSDADGNGIPETHGANQYGENISWMSNTLGGGSGQDPDPWFKIDLGTSYTLDHMRVWNFNVTLGNNARGVQTGDIYVSNSPSDPGSSFTDPAWTLLEAGHAFPIAPGNSDYDAPDVIGLSGLTARWLAIDITSNYGDTRFVGLSEIQVFEKVAEIPEPLTLLGVLAGIGGLGAYARKRRGGRG